MGGGGNFGPDLSSTTVAMGRFTIDCGRGGFGGGNSGSDEEEVGFGNFGVAIGGSVG